MKKTLWTLKGLNFSYYATSAVLSTFLPIFFHNKGYSSSQIGLLMMIGPFVAIFAQPLWGYLGDRYQSLKLLLYVLWSMTVLSSAGVFLTNGYTLALLFMTLIYFFMLSSTPLLDTLTVKTARQASIGYGTIRVFGSAGFTVMAFMTGPLLAAYGGMKNVHFLYWSVWVLPMALLLFLKNGKESGPRTTFSQFSGLFRDRRFLWFLFLIFLMSIPHRMNDSMMILHLKELGGSDTMAGMAWALIAASEIPVFLLLGRYMNRFHEMALLTIIALLFSLRWFLSGMMTDPLSFTLLQTMNSVTYAAFWIVSVQYVVRIVPKELQSTGLSLLSMVFLGIAGITGGSVGGWIRDQFGGTTMYYIGAAVAAFAAILMAMTHAYDRKKVPASGRSTTLNPGQ